jgi:two-component system CheB/CheR fusion protein
VTVEPLKIPKEAEGLLLVCFEDRPEAEPLAAEAAVPAGDEWLVRQLEAELKTTREDLQSTIEELETSNEELKAANEEVMSVNEELQSTNEELETSKEELQSLNEELSTVNAQLESKVEELERTTNDLDNLLTSTTIPTIFLDRDFRIRRLTPAVTQVFNLIATDVGRPMRDIAQKFADPALLEDAAVVIERLSPLSREVRAEGGRWYMRQVLPYRTQDDRIEGVVITFSDVAGQALQESRLYAEAIVETVHDAWLVLDGDLRVFSANRAFCELFRMSREETEGQLLYELGNREWDIPTLRSLLGRILLEKVELTDFEVEQSFEKIGQRIMLLNGRQLSRSVGQPPLILLAMKDITARKQSERALAASEARLRGIVATAADGIITIDERGIIESFNSTAERFFGYRADEVTGRKIETLMPSPYREEHDGYLSRYLETGVARIIGSRREVMGRRKDGSTFPMELGVSEFFDGAHRKFTGLVRDITDRRQAEERERQRQAELARVLRVITVGELSGGLAHELNQPLAAIANDVEACAAYVRAGEGKSRKLLVLLERAAKEAVRAGEIVNRLRDFLQRKELRKQPAELSELVRNVLPLLQSAYDEQRIGLRVELGDERLPVLVDPVQVEQVVLNIVQNAADALLEVDRPRQIVVRARMTEDRARAELTVEDNGVGLRAEKRKRLFEPFFTTKEGGLGMGLTISRSIVEAHDGTITVEPRPSRVPGTVVRVMLPLARGRKPAMRERSSNARTRKNGSP